MTSTTALGPLTKSVRVAATPARAFELFTARLGAWWPLATHSVGGTTSRGVVMECRAGGRLVETLADGGTTLWGEVTEWDPPREVAFTWHPGTPAEEATKVALSFAAEGTGTVVTLLHTGWDARPDGAEARVAYDSGWDVIVSEYLRLAGE